MIAEVAIRQRAASPHVGVPRSAPRLLAPRSYGRAARTGFALGLETIYEGYLVHDAESRLFAPADRAQALLLGDFCSRWAARRLPMPASCARWRRWPS